MIDIKSLLTDDALFDGCQIGSIRPIFKHTGESFIMAKPVADVLAIADPNPPVIPNIPAYKTYLQTSAGQAMKIGTELDNYITELNYPMA